MSAEWPIVKLEDILEIIVDYRGKTPPKSKNGIPVLTAASVKEGRILRDKVSYISRETYDRVTTRGFPKKGDVLITTEAPVGEVAPMPYDRTYHITRRIMALRGDKVKVDSGFLLYVLLGESCQGQLRSAYRGSTVSRVLKTDITNLLFRLPPLKKQRFIGGFLSCIDNKIELNNQINQTLEKIAQALFKSWFIDFEPVKAKIAAKQRWLAMQPGNEAASPVCYASELMPEPPQHDLETTMSLAAMEAISGKNEAQLTRLQAEQPEEYAELRATAELFPSAMKESELGEIPEGWSAPEIREQVVVLRGFSYKGKGLSDSGTPMHNLNSILEGGGYKYSGIKCYSLEFKKKFEVVPGDVLVANTEQGHAHLLIGYGAAVPSFYGTSIFSHHLYRVRPKLGSHITKEFLAMLFKEPAFVKRVQGFANGTTVNMLPMAGIQMPIFVCPPKILAEKFSELVRPHIATAENHYLDSRSLSSLRDTLLPKLLSGELTIPDAETAGQEVIA